MASTVIDSLVVLLGLDASNYKKGRETAEKETSETARKAKAGADQITKSLTEVGKSIAGLFLGFESATGFAKWLGGLNAGEAALGRTAANIGMGAHELNKWGNAVELAGGSAQDAQAAFTELTNDAEKFFVTGEASPLINTLRQYGVDLKDSNGHLRNQGEIFEELADKTAVYGREYQNFALKQAGITQGEINYLAQSKTQREDNLRTAERDNAVTDETVKKAAELQMYWRNIGLQIQAAGQMILTALTPTLTQLLKVFGDVNAQSDEFTTGLKLIGSAAVVIKNLFSGIGNSIGGAAAAIGAALRGDFKGAAAILKDQSAQSEARNAKEAADLNDLWEGQSAAKSAVTVANSGDATYRNHNPGNLFPYKAGQPTDSRGIRTFTSDAEGAQALEDDLRTKMRRGLHTVDSIIDAFEGHDNVRNNIPAYQADVRNRLGKNELTESDIKQLARAITIHEDARVKTAKAAGGSTTTVQVDTINVHSASADPKAVADQVPAAIQRKYSVSQADTGQS